MGISKKQEGTPATAAIMGGQGEGGAREAKSEKQAVFVGRQPIFDKSLNVYGYELLFRSGNQNSYSCDDDDQATREVIANSMNLMGLSDVVGGKKLFFNITRPLLLDELYTVLPEKLAVVELLETIEPDAEVLAACEQVKKNGYALALDDFVFEEGFRPLLEIADMVKIDFMVSDRDERRGIIEKFSRPGLTFLAEKIETPEEYEEAIALGYTLFQGYFFSKPKILEGRNIPGEKQKYLQFLQAVQAPVIDFDELEQIVKSDASISVKLLKYLNSAGMGLREKITSIKQSLVYLGERPLRKWASLLAMTGMAIGKPAELMRTSLVRGQFCELICDELKLGGRELDMFMLGMLSAVDALLDCPMDRVLSQLPLADDVKATLLGDSSDLGKVKMMVLACERGDWTTACMLGKMLGADQQRVAESYAEAVRWADEVMRI